MRPTQLIPMLWTEQLDASIAFYTQTLHFTCGEKNDTWQWAALHNGEVELMLAKPNAHMPFTAPQFTGSFYFRVTDVAPLWERLKDKVSIVYPLDTFDWGMREFAIYDNNGYILQFGEALNP